MEPVSKRLTDQRLRNRIIEVVEMLALGDAAVDDAGDEGEYFNLFDDFVSFGNSRTIQSNSALSSAEIDLLFNLKKMVDAAFEATVAAGKEKELLSEGWAQRIQPIAESVLSSMRKRGRFSEDVEELEPSQCS